MDQERKFEEERVLEKEARRKREKAHRDEFRQLLHARFEAGKLDPRDEWEVAPRGCCSCACRRLARACGRLRM
jgi:hypothetical protein